jgi:hypothetical protein
MSSYEYSPDDAIAAALGVLQCSPDEIAAALGIDEPTLWSYCNGERRAPSLVLRRLASLLDRRAVMLCGLSETLARGASGRGGTVVS